MHKILLLTSLLGMASCATVNQKIMHNGNEHTVMLRDYFHYGLGANQSGSTFGRIGVNDIAAKVSYSPSSDNMILNNYGKHVNLRIGWKEYSLGTGGLCVDGFCMGPVTHFGMFTLFPEFAFVPEVAAGTIIINLINGVPDLFGCTHPDTMLVKQASKGIEDLIFSVPRLLDRAFGALYATIFSPYDEKPVWELILALEQSDSKISDTERFFIKRELASRTNLIGEQKFSVLKATSSGSELFESLYNDNNSINRFLSFPALTSQLSDVIETSEYEDDVENDDGSISKVTEHTLSVSRSSRDNFKAYYLYITSETFRTQAASFYELTSRTGLLFKHSAYSQLIVEGLNPKDNPAAVFSAHGYSKMLDAISDVSLVTKVASALSGNEPYVPIEARILKPRFPKGFELKTANTARTYSELAYEHLTNSADLFQVSNAIAYLDTKDFMPEVKQLLMDMRAEDLALDRCKYVHKQYFTSRNISWCSEADPTDEDFAEEYSYRLGTEAFMTYMTPQITEADKVNCFGKKA